MPVLDPAEKERAAFVRNRNVNAIRRERFRCRGNGEVPRCHLHGSHALSQRKSPEIIDDYDEAVSLARCGVRRCEQSDSGGVLKCRSRLAEKNQFVVCGGPAENPVAVRKAAEARDNVAVANGEVEVLGKNLFLIVAHIIEQLTELPNRLLLNLQGFGVFERQVEEYSFDGPELKIEPLGDSVEGPCQGSRILRESFGRLAIDIARKLIREQDQSQATVRS